MITVLVVEDDENSRLLTVAHLNKKYNVISCENGEEAIDIIYSQKIDIIVADLMMPKMDGYELIKTLRENKNNIPVLLLTAKNTIQDKTRGFEYGADDYLTKPVDYTELMLRINALARRANITSQNKISIGKIEIDINEYSLKYDGNPIPLTKKEFDLLFKLISYPNKIFTKTQLIEEIWGYDRDVLEDSIKTYINKLRAKLANISEIEIVNLKGIGYKLVVKEENV